MLDCKQQGMDPIDESGDDIALDRNGDDQPIPDEIGAEISLDRKGDDKPVPDIKAIEANADEQVGKIVGPNPKEEIIHTMEVNSGIGASGFRDKFEGLDNTSVYENLEPILGRLVIDKVFREQLTRDPLSVLGEYDLSEEEIHLLSQMPRDQLEQVAAEVQARFADTSEAPIQEAHANLLAELLWGIEEEQFDIGGATHEDSWKGE